MTVLPVAPLKDGPVFPYTDVPLAFSRDKSVNALKSAADTSRLIFITGQKDPKEADPQDANFQEIGTICQIKHLFQAESEVNVLVTGMARAKLVRLQTLSDLTVAEVEEIPDQPVVIDDPEIKALVTHVTFEFQKAIRLGRGFDFFCLDENHQRSWPGGTGQPDGPNFRFFSDGTPDSFGRYGH